MFTQVAGILAGVTALIDFIAYDVSILRGKTRPNRATWFILTVVGILITASYYSVGARDTLWMPIGYTVGPFIAFLLSIKYGEGGWTTFDKVCLFTAMISVIFWYLSGSALIALLINIFIDFLGMLPTIKKSYLDPNSEELHPWVITFIAGILNLLAISTFNFDIIIYPIYMFLVNGVVVFFLFRYYLKKRA
jgi:hypothetical protein